MYLTDPPSRYEYKGFWIEIVIEADFERGCVLYEAVIELNNRGGIIKTCSTEIREEAEFAAEEMIDSWN